MNNDEAERERRRLHNLFWTLWVFLQHWYQANSVTHVSAHWMGIRHTQRHIKGCDWGGLFHRRWVKETQPVISDVNYFHHPHTHTAGHNNHVTAFTMWKRIFLFTQSRGTINRGSLCPCAGGHAAYKHTGLLEFCPSWTERRVFVGNIVTHFNRCLQSHASLLV